MLGGPALEGNTGAGGSAREGSCGAGGREVVYRVVVDRPVRATFSTVDDGTNFDTVLALRAGCGLEAAELGCNNNVDADDQRAQLTVSLEPGVWFLVVDSGVGGGDFVLHTTFEVEAALCNNGRDDDFDGASDLADVGCADGADSDESDPGLAPACSNGLDDDADGHIDAADPGCASVGDTDELDPTHPPRCADGIDQDQDGATDWPQDPGCRAAGADSEFGAPAACGDGRDNDGDGRIDLGDPGCAWPADVNEIEEGPPSACANDADDDLDGRSDYPADPGCTAAGDTDELDPAVAPVCSNGLDDDGDGRIDYPAEPGCISAADPEETDPMRPPVCANGQDDDGDARTDWPDDPDCAAASAVESGPLGFVSRCADGADNDGDGHVDLDDLGCAQRRDDDEADPVGEAPLCANGEDDDGDGATDWPLDDGCAARGGECEQAGYGRCDGQCLDLRHDREHCGRCDRACADGLACIDGQCGGIGDNLLICRDLWWSGDDLLRGEVAGLTVVNGCSPDEDTQALLINRNGLGELQLRGAEWRNWLEAGGVLITEHRLTVDVAHFVLDLVVPEGPWNGNCSGNVAPAMQLSPDDPFWQDNAFEPWPLEQSGCGLSIESESIPGFVALGGWSPGTVSLGYLEVGAGRIWFAETDWQDHPDMSETSRDLFAYMISGGRRGPPSPACANRRDDDGDGRVDAEDPGCAADDDADELDPPGDLPTCANARDDDADGRIDHPADPGCAAAVDADETDADDVPACANGADDDEDGAIDWPEDSGCASAAGASELDGRRRPECANGRDDDEDLRLDWPADPGCLAAGDLSEADGPNAPACADDADNDADGYVDWPYEPGCATAGDTDEQDPAIAGACANRVDDDFDGRSDFPIDPGCTSAGDRTEEDSAQPPACANGRDDDGDTWADFPFDTGCLSAGDPDESGGGRPIPRCANGVDDDRDGAPDLRDPGCSGRTDDDERDPAQPARCFNAADDDGDGAIDWPADEGCAAQGGVCEEPGYIDCGGVCVDPIGDEAHCGRCDRVCAADVECLDGFCGGLFTFEGIARDIPEDELGGWTPCFQGGYDNFAALDAVLEACTGDQVMYGCRPAGAETYTLLAMGDREEVFRDTGDNNNVVNLHNGVAFYFSRNFSLGFVGEGTTPERNSCDTGAEQPELRMCWHTGGDAINPGWRCGEAAGIGGPDWERVIFHNGPPGDVVGGAGGPVRARPARKKPAAPAPVP